MRLRVVRQSYILLLFLLLVAGAWPCPALATDGGVSLAGVVVEADGFPPEAQFFAEWGAGPDRRVRLRAVPAECCLTVIATGEKNPSSNGSEVWLTGLRHADGKSCQPAEFILDNGWEHKPTETGQVLVSHANQPAAVTWCGRACRQMRLSFVRHEWSGIVEIDWNGVKQRIDLYSPGGQRTLRLPVGVTRWRGTVPYAPDNTTLRIVARTVCPHDATVRSVRITTAAGTRHFEADDMSATRAKDNGEPFEVTCRLVGEGTLVSPCSEPVRDILIDHRFCNRDASSAVGVPDTRFWPRTSVDARGTIYFVHPNTPMTTAGGAPTSKPLGRLRLGEPGSISPKPLNGYLPVYDWSIAEGNVRLLSLPDERATDVISLNLDDPLGLQLKVDDGQLTSRGKTVFLDGTPFLTLLCSSGDLEVSIAADGRQLCVTVPRGRTRILKNVDLQDATAFLRTSEWLVKQPESPLEKETVDIWNGVVERAMRFDVPNAELRNAYRRAVVQLFLLRSRLEGKLVLHGSGGTAGGGAYDWGFWYRDYSYHTLALDTVGFHQEATEQYGLFWQHQDENGLLVAPAGQYDGFGQVAWAAYRHCRYQPAAATAGELRRHLARAAEAVRRLREDYAPGESLACEHLLPPGLGDSGISQPHQLMVNHNAWCVVGLDRLERMTRDDGDDVAADAVAERRRELQDSLSTVIPFLFVETAPAGGFVSGALDDTTLRPNLRKYAALFVLRWPHPIFAASDVERTWMMDATVESFWEDSFCSLPLGLGWVDGAIWPYNALDWAQVFLRDGEADRALRVFGDALNCSWSTGSWAEEYSVNRRTGEVLEANTGYDVPNTNMHVTAPSGMLLFLRNILITDDEHTGIIEIGKGLPTSWLGKGRSPIRVQAAPTLYGRAELVLARQEDRISGHFRLERNGLSGPRAIVLHVRLPKGEEPRAATCNGRNLELTPGAAELTLAEGDSASEWEFELTLGQVQQSP